MTEIHYIVSDPDSLQLRLAYLDPGTGSILLSVIIAFLSSLYFVGRGLIDRVVDFIFGRRGRRIGELHKHHDLVLYSEGNQYVDLFMPLLRELCARKQSCLYLTGSSADPALDMRSEYLNHICIGEGYGAWSTLNRLRADVCVMTTPGLDTLQIKRSKSVKHYVHLIHSPTDKSFNRPFSFDYYDSVFISGQHQAKVLRYLERLRNLPPKNLVETGCVYYDELVRKKNALTASHKAGGGHGTTVLVAPTWGRNSLLRRFGPRIVRNLIDAGNRVILRPHPQTRLSEPELLTEVWALAASNDRFLIDDSRSPFDSMLAAGVMVSDISGIIFDFAFVLERPVITIESVVDKRGFEAMDLPFEPWDISVLGRIGRVVPEDDIASLPDIVSSLRQDEKTLQRIRALRGESVVNFGAAATPIVDAIQQILQVSKVDAERRKGTSFDRHDRI